MSHTLNQFHTHTYQKLCKHRFSYTAATLTIKHMAQAISGSNKLPIIPSHFFVSDRVRRASSPYGNLCVTWTQRQRVPGVWRTGGWDDLGRLAECQTTLGRDVAVDVDVDDPDSSI